MQADRETRPAKPLIVRPHRFPAFDVADPFQCRDVAPRLSNGFAGALGNGRADPFEKTQDAAQEEQWRREAAAYDEQRRAEKSGRTGLVQFISKARFGLKNAGVC